MRRVMPVALAAAIAMVTLQARTASVVALVNGTVFVGDGRVMPHATVVLRDEFIEAVGAEVKPPARATVIDAAGLSIYPGLIDVLTEVGLQKAPAARPGEGDGADPLQAWVRAADRLDASTRALDAWRDAGVLALNVAPDRGIFMGQAALVSPSGGLPAQRIVQPSTAMRLNLRGLGYRNRRPRIPEPGGPFPQRLVGVYGLIRQALVSAHEYDEALKIYSANPAGTPRPAFDRVSEALRPVAAGSMPLFWPAYEQREVERAVRLSKELAVRTIVVGGYEALEVPDLKASKTAVAIDLNYPGPERDTHPEFEVPARILRYRAAAPAAAGALAAAGVPIAFTSGGLDSGARFIAALRLTVKAGLPKAAALRAATVTPAALLGVSRQLGSVEPGKLANLIVVDGDLFEDAGRVRLVVAEGRILDRRAAAAFPSSAPPMGVMPEGVAREPAVAPPSTLLFTNATLMTVSHGTLRNMSLLVRNGKIAAIAPAIAPPPGAQVIDATGMWMTPGFIDNHSHIATDSHNEATSNATSSTRILDVLNPADMPVYRVVASGVTTANTLHGSVNPIGGQTVVIKMKYGRTVPEMLFPGAKPGLKFAVKEFARRQGQTPPSSLAGVDAVYRDYLSRAKAYGQRWDEYRAANAAGRPWKIPPARDLTLEPLVEVMRGERLLHVHCYSPQEILLVMHVAEDFGFKVQTFQHAIEAYKIADEVKAHGGGGASVFWQLSLAKPYNAVLLEKKGVVVSVNSDGEQIARYLNQQVANIMTLGDFEENRALAMITLNAAKQLGIEGRVGSLDVGKDADLVLFKHYPLSVYGIPERVFIDGEEFFSRERDAARARTAAEERQHFSSLRPTTTAAAGGGR